MDSRQVIYDTFLKRFEDSSRNSIGVELEFPMVNTACAPVDEALMHKMLENFLNEDFKAEEYDREGNPVFISDKNDDVLSFDNSYNNFEFSMGKADNLTVVADRFYILLDRVQSFLKPYGYELKGVVAGFNNRFGHKAAGDSAMLQRMGQEQGFAVEILPFCNIMIVS